MRQTLSIDLDIGVPGEAVFRTDKVADTIDYEQVALRIAALAGERPLPPGRDARRPHRARC